MNQEELNKQCYKAVCDGDIYLIEFFVKQGADIHLYHHDLFSACIQTNRIHIIEYFIHEQSKLLSSLTTDSTELIIIKQFIDEINELEKKQEYKDFFSMWVCLVAKLTTLQYLIDKGVYAPHDIVPFVAACRTKRTDIIHFFIFDINFQLTNELKKELEEWTDINTQEEIYKLFNTRDLKYKLDNELLIHPHHADHKISSAKIIKL